MATNEERKAITDRHADDRRAIVTALQPDVDMLNALAYELEALVMPPVESGEARSILELAQHRLRQARDTLRSFEDHVKNQEPTPF